MKIKIKIHPFRMILTLIVGYLMIQANSPLWLFFVVAIWGAIEYGCGLHDKDNDNKPAAG